MCSTAVVSPKCKMVDAVCWQHFKLWMTPADVVGGVVVSRTVSSEISGRLFRQQQLQGIHGTDKDEERVLYGVLGMDTAGTDFHRGQVAVL